MQRKRFGAIRDPRLPPRRKSMRLRGRLHGGPSRRRVRAASCATSVHLSPPRPPRIVATSSGTEAARARGRARAGVSNFNSRQLRSLAQAASVVPEALPSQTTRAQLRSDIRTACRRARGFARAGESGGVAPLLPAGGTCAHRREPGRCPSGLARPSITSPSIAVSTISDNRSEAILHSPQMQPVSWEINSLRSY